MEINWDFYCEVLKRNMFTVLMISLEKFSGYFIAKSNDPVIAVLIAYHCEGMFPDKVRLGSQCPAIGLTKAWSCSLTSPSHFPLGENTSALFSRVNKSTSRTANTWSDGMGMMAKRSGCTGGGSDRATAFRNTASPINSAINGIWVALLSSLHRPQSIPPIVQ